jgi:hypothetical protein
MVLERALDALIDKLAARRFGLVKAPRESGSAAKGKTSTRTNAQRAETKAAESTDASGNTPAIPATRQRQHIPRAVRRTVAERDGLTCSFVAADGTRCDGRAFVQLHHELPWAAGGENTPENLRPLCAAHNRLLAESAHDGSRRRR